MAKILLVSTYPYHKTSRGMDLMTEALEEAGHDVTHLTFPHVWYIPEKNEKFPTKVKEAIGKKVLLPYVDKLMFWFPRWLFGLWVKQHLWSVDLDFSAFDTIVLESGKPMFLLDRIPEDVQLIYRQSDSVRHALGKGRWYIDLEDRVMDRAQRILMVKKTYQDDLIPEHKKKSLILRNGFSPPPKNQPRPPFLPNNRLLAVYFGLTPLDGETLRFLLEKNRDMDFHIMGTCLGKKTVQSLDQWNNFYYHGYLTAQEYGPILEHSHVAIVPYGNVPAVKWMGFTSKYMVYMHYGLPIISYPTGRPGEFDPYPQIKIVESKESFQEEIQKVKARPEKIAYDFDFDYYSKDQIKVEYQNLFS